MVKFFGAGIVPSLMALASYSYVGGPISNLQPVWLVASTFIGGIMIYIIIALMLADDQKSRLSYHGYVNVAALTNTLALALIASAIYALWVLVLPTKPIQASLAMMTVFVALTLMSQAINRRVAISMKLIVR